MMFGLVERPEENLFHMFDRFDRTAYKEPIGFRTDIREENELYQLDAELPGFTRDEIFLDLKAGILTIKAEHAQEVEPTGYIRKERFSGNLMRSFDVSGIREEGITASFHDGILSLTLPKQMPTVPENRRIAIS
ncbi:MAG: Hsp20/alpha crystallin family protein [Evtepia sp.]